MPKRVSRRKRQLLKAVRRYEQYVAGSPEMQALIADDAQEREIPQQTIGELIVELSEFVRNRETKAASKSIFEGAKLLGPLV